MSDHGDTHLNLFFFTVGGVHFAVDVEQAVGMTPYTGEEAEDLFRFHEELDFGNNTVTYHAPIVVTVRTVDGRPYRVIVDALEEIAEFSRNDMRPFPALLEPIALRYGMWAILPLHGRIVLLVDFQRLLQHKRVA